MQLHGEFYAMTKRHARLVSQLNTPDAMDGAYSRVTVLGPYSVLKATSCKPTQQLLRELSEGQRQASPASLALPAVLRQHGVIARDRDAVTYEGWEVERLFGNTDTAAMRLARVTGKATLAGLKPQYESTHARLSENLAQDLMQALKEEQAYWGHENHWKACAEIALAMSLRTDGYLRDTFLFLLRFVRKHEAALDILTGGNFLWDMFGRVCLSDPVCEADPQAHVQERNAGQCLASWIPVRVQGTRVLLEPRSTFALNEAERQETQGQMQALGLTPQDLQWGSAAHQAFMHQAPREVPVWDVPAACKNLKAGLYEQVFTG